MITDFEGEMLRRIKTAFTHFQPWIKEVMMDAPSHVAIDIHHKLATYRDCIFSLIFPTH
jgi:hypothetical protein